MIATTLEQSKKLIELGIDVNTADMYFCGHRSLMNPKETEYEDYPKIKGNYISFDNLEIFYPAWSLSALLGFMPKLYEFENDPEDGGCQPNLCKGWDNNQWHVVYRSSIYITEWYDDPLDAACNMVIWLIEQGYIKNK